MSSSLPSSLLLTLLALLQLTRCALATDVETHFRLLRSVEGRVDPAAARPTIQHYASRGTPQDFHKSSKSHSTVSKDSSQGQGQAQWVEVIETETRLASSLGDLTQKCMTLVNDQSQSFCALFIDGVFVGSDTGLGTNIGSDTTTAGCPSSTASSTSSTSVTASASASITSVEASSTASASDSSVTSTEASDTASASSTTSISVDAVVDGATATAGSTSASVSGSGASASTTASVDAIVNAPAATSSVSIPPFGFALLSSEAQSPEELLTTQEASVTALAAGAGASGSSTTVTGSIFVVNALPSNTASATAAAVTAAKAEAQTSTATIPGQKLQVLPIGLGIFGGLAVLTMIIVGYVMYERRKYKLQFRRRKDAEKSGFANQGAAMGYGGGSI